MRDFDPGEKSARAAPDQPADGSRLPEGWTGRFQSVPLESEDAAEIIAPLDTGERDILGLVTLGLYNKEIGGRIFASESTIKGYVGNIMQSLNVRDRWGARSIACASGLLVQAASTGRLPQTRGVLLGNSLGIEDAKIMSAHELTIADFKFLTWTAGGLIQSEVAKLFGIQRSTLICRNRLLYRRLGVKNMKQAHEETGITS